MWTQGREEDGRPGGAFASTHLLRVGILPGRTGPPSSARCSRLRRGLTGPGPHKVGGGPGRSQGQRGSPLKASVDAHPTLPRAAWEYCRPDPRVSATGGHSFTDETNHFPCGFSTLTSQLYHYHIPQMQSAHPPSSGHKKVSSWSTAHLSTACKPAPTTQ